MPEIVADGQPFQSSTDAANSIYASTPPSFGRGFGALFSSESSIERGERATERGQYLGASPFDRYLTVTGMANAGLPVPAPIVTPELPPDEANKRYAPPGTKITDKPMREGIAALVGKAKQDEIEREQVLSRFEANHSWLGNFAYGTVAFALDPLNASTMLIPGLGEDAVAGVLGRGFLARTAGRLVAGATGAAAGQAPLAAAQYGLSQEEAGDYSARDALRDVFFAAAGGAVIHAGIRSIAEIGRPATGERPSEKPAPEAEAPAAHIPISSAPAEQKYAAMRSGISQILDGRPVDVMPVIDTGALRLASREAELRNAAAEIDTRLAALRVTPEAEVAREKLSRLEVVERNMADETLQAGDRKALGARRDELLTDTTPEQLRAAADPIEQKRALENQKAQIEAQLNEVATQKTRAALDQIGLGAAQAGTRLMALADDQRQLYRNGYAQGIPQGEFNAVYEKVYGPKAAEAERSERPALAEKPEAAKTEREPKEAAAEPKPTLPKTPEEKDADEFEAQWKRVAETQPVRLTPEQISDIQSAVAEYDRAQKAAVGMDQAAICLDEAGV